MEEKDIDQKAIRTYESDIANSIQHRQTSQASIVMAAEEKQHQQENVLVVHANDAGETKNRGAWVKNTLMVLGSLILLAAGVAVAYYFYTISPLSVKQPTTPASTVPTAALSPGIVTADVQKVSDITGQNVSGILGKIQQIIQANPLQNGGILEIIFGQQATSTQNGKTATSLVRVTGPQFISLLGLQAPNGLTSSLTNNWMFGAYFSLDATGATTSAQFMIFTDNFFQNAFAGMLGWESTMPSNFAGLFGIQPEQWSGGSFHDKLIKNKSVREFTDSNGNMLFLYSFIDNNTLVIAQNEAALGEIITRLGSQAYVR